jgi:hypothetical protein
MIKPLFCFVSIFTLSACGSSGKDDPNQSCTLKKEGQVTKLVCPDGTETSIEVGKDGKDGKDGQPGKDGETKIVKVYLNVADMTGEQKSALCYDEKVYSGVQSGFPVYLRSAINKSNWHNRKNFIISASSSCTNIVSTYVDMLNEVLQ